MCDTHPLGLCESFFYATDVVQSIIISLTIVGPVFLIIGIGVLLKCFHFIDQPLSDRFSHRSTCGTEFRLDWVHCYWVFLSDGHFVLCYIPILGI